MIKRTPELSSFADHTRVWVFQSSQVLRDVVQREISSILDDFLEKWAAHGADLYAGFEIRLDRFILIAVDEHRAPATGCSIDSMMKVVQQIDQHYELDLLNRMKVAYWDGEEIMEVNINSFTRMLANGELNENTTIVFNNIVQNKGELDAQWEIPVKNSWFVNLMS